MRTLGACACALAILVVPATAGAATEGQQSNQERAHAQAASMTRNQGEPVTLVHEQNEQGGRTTYEYSGNFVARGSAPGTTGAAPAVRLRLTYTASGFLEREVLIGPEVAAPQAPGPPASKRTSGAVNARHHRHHRRYTHGRHHGARAASWGTNGECKKTFVGEANHHCYALDEWYMPYPQELEGLTLAVASEWFNITDWGFNGGYGQYETWLVFAIEQPNPETEEWIETGFRNGGPTGCCSLHRFYEYYNLYNPNTKRRETEKWSEEAEWPTSWGAANFQIDRITAEKGGYQWGIYFNTELKPTHKVVYASTKLVQNGEELSTEEEPYSIGWSESMSQHMNGGWYAWGYDELYEIPSSGTHQCIRVNPHRPRRGDAQWYDHRAWPELCG